MSEKRFEPVFSGDTGTVYIGVKDNQEDELLMTLDTIEMLNNLHEENVKKQELINLLQKDVSDAFVKLNNINKKVIDFSKRDLVDIERIFLKNFCKEANMGVFCMLNEEEFCNSCMECSHLIEDYWNMVL